MEERCLICGAPIENGKCSYCGYLAPVKNQNIENNIYSQSQPQVIANTVAQSNSGYKPGKVREISPKSKTTALILCIFLGYIGAHKFYVGKSKMGMVYIFTVGLCGMGWLMDTLLILMDSFKDSDGLILKN